MVICCIAKRIARSGAAALLACLLASCADPEDALPTDVEVEQVPIVRIAQRESLGGREFALHRNSTVSVHPTEESRPAIIFRRFTGTLLVGNQRIAQRGHRIVIDTRSIQAHQPGSVLPQALNAEKGFSVERFPTIALRFRVIENDRSQGNSSANIEGVLDFREHRIPVSFPVSLQISETSIELNGTASVDLPGLVFSDADVTALREFFGDAMIWRWQLRWIPVGEDGQQAFTIQKPPPPQKSAPRPPNNSNRRIVPTAQPVRTENAPMPIKTEPD